MTVVLQTVAGVNPDTDAAIRQVLSRYGLKRQETSASVGGDFHYYHIQAQPDADAVVRALMQRPGVLAAYVKPEGIPPL